MCQWVPPSLCFSSFTLPRQLRLWRATAEAAPGKGTGGGGYTWGIGCPGCCLGWDTTRFSCCWCSGCEKKLHLLVGFWVGLRNAFTPLLFHTTFLAGPSLGFIIYLTFLQNFIEVDRIWVAACSPFQHVYFQFVCQIIFQAFHSFVRCNLFFNELAWGT